jgi:hypothetical protein
MSHCGTPLLFVVVGNSARSPVFADPVTATTLTPASRVRSHRIIYYPFSSSAFSFRFFPANFLQLFIQKSGRDTDFVALVSQKNCLFHSV